MILASMFALYLCISCSYKMKIGLENLGTNKCRFYSTLTANRIDNTIIRQNIKMKRLRLRP